MDSNQPDIEGRFRTLLILWFAMLMSIATFAAMTFIVPGGRTNNRQLSLILNCAGIAPLAISFLIKQRLLDKAIQQQALDHVQVAYVVSFALTESAALLAFADHAVNGAIYFYLGFAIGLLGMLLHFPRKQHLLDASQQQF
jgi:hypothetical protein